MQCLFAGNQNAFLAEIIRSSIHEGRGFPAPNLGDNVPRPIDTSEYSPINRKLLVADARAVVPFSQQSIAGPKRVLGWAREIDRATDSWRSGNIAPDDGGNKPAKLKAVVGIAKPGDIVLAHDYAPNRQVFKTNIRGKRRNWCEITDADLPATGIRPIELPKLRDVIWCSCGPDTPGNS